MRGKCRQTPVFSAWVHKGALQVLIKCYGQIRSAQVPERILAKSFVVLIMRSSKSNHLGAQGNFKVRIYPMHIYIYCLSVTLRCVLEYS